MLSKPSLAVFVSLAVCAAATLLADGGIAIPLNKRSAGFTDSKRVVDRELLRQAIASANIKYPSSLQIPRKTVNTEGFASVIPDVNTGDNQTQSPKAVPLSSFKDQQWTGKITVGKQTFNIDFDTGSYDLWLPSIDCKTDTCQKKNRYDTSTGKLQNGTFHPAFADASVLSGLIYTDTVTVGGVTVEDQYFSALTNWVDSGYYPTDGVLGLSFPEVSVLKQSSFFDSAVTQGAVKKAEFSFYLASQGSELFLGGSNPDLYTGELETHAIQPGSGFWRLEGGSGSTEEKSGAVTNISAIIDSGTAYIFGPTNAVNELYYSTREAVPAQGEYGMFQFPCDSVPKVSFSWGGKEWPVHPENLNMGPTSEGSHTCLGSIIGGDRDFWIFGDAFMKNVYTTFSVADKTVSFATLK